VGRIELAKFIVVVGAR